MGGIIVHAVFEWGITHKQELIYIQLFIFDNGVLKEVVWQKFTIALDNILTDHAQIIQEW